MELSRFLPPGLRAQRATAAGNGGPSNGGWLAWLQVVGGFLVIFNAQ